jgi:hypothetical protein
MEMQLQLSQAHRLEIRESCCASALPQTFEYVHQDQASFESQLELAWSNSKGMRKRKIDECEPVDLLLWIYAPVLRAGIEQFYEDKGKRLNKLYPKRVCKKIDSWLLCVLQAHVACTDMLSRKDFS